MKNFSIIHIQFMRLNILKQLIKTYIYKNGIMTCQIKSLVLLTIVQDLQINRKVNQMNKLIYVRNETV